MSENDHTMSSPSSDDALTLFARKACLDSIGAFTNGQGATTYPRVVWMSPMPRQVVLKIRTTTTNGPPVMDNPRGCESIVPETRSTLTSLWSVEWWLIMTRPRLNTMSRRMTLVRT